MTQERFLNFSSYFEYLKNAPLCPINSALTPVDERWHWNLSEEIIIYFLQCHNEQRVSSLKYTYWLGFIIPLGFPLWKYIEGPKEMPEKALGLVTSVVTALYKTTKKWPLSFGVVKILKHFHTIFWSKFFKFYSFILLCSLKQILNESLMCGSLILAPDAAAYKVQTILSPGTFVLRRKRDYKWIVTRSRSSAVETDTAE